MMSSQFAINLVRTVLLFGVGYGFLGPLFMPADFLPRIAKFLRANSIPISLVIVAGAVLVPAFVYAIARVPPKFRAQSIVTRAFVYYVLGLAIGQCSMVLLGWLGIVDPPQNFEFCLIFAAINLLAAFLGFFAMKAPH
jgi:hypothetical protein